MIVKITRIGNSRGIRIPKEVLDIYRLRDGDELELDHGPEGIRLSPTDSSTGKLSFAASYREMAQEVAEGAWEEWETTSADGADELYDH